MQNVLVQLRWLSMTTYFTFEPGSPGIPRPPSIPERPWVTHSSQMAALCSTARYTSDFFSVKICNTQDILFFPAFLWVPADLATPAVPFDKNRSMSRVRHKLRQGMMWFNKCKSGWKMSVLTAGPLSPLFPLRPVGPGPPCMIERIQQTWFYMDLYIYYKSLESLKFYTNQPHFYNQYECITQVYSSTKQLRWFLRSNKLRVCCTCGPGRPDRPTVPGGPFIDIWKVKISKSVA